MGIMKKYIGAWAIEIANLKYDDGALSTSSTVSFKDTTGTSRTSIEWYFSSSYQGTSSASANSFRHTGLIPVATADILDDYDINDYQITSIGNVSQNNVRVVNSNNAHLTYNVTISNSGADPITVNCIKFKKHMFKQHSNGPVYYDLLMYGYFLDEPLVIDAGESESLNVDFEIKIQ